MEERQIVVIGGGAAGMMAAIAASEKGRRVILCEKNEKLGKKLYITGKGRCNVTNACGRDKFFENVVSNPKFLYSAFSEFDNTAMMALLENNGCSLKTERGERVFPASDHASDVTAALECLLRKRGVTVRLGAAAEELLTENNEITGVMLKGGERLPASAVVLATGGLSYPSTGSTGDGYRMAENLGHTVKECSPGLVPIEIREAWCADLQGLSLKNVELTMCDGVKKIWQGFGEMLFTHFGISGPLALTASSYYARCKDQEHIAFTLDLKPALTAQQLDRRILREFEENRNKNLRNVIGSLYPAKLTPVILSLSGIDPEKKIHEITREERETLVQLTKGLTMHAAGLRGFAEAVITKGGVNVKEVNPSTMESKRVRGLYFAGEILDLDALTGGFNLQIAWSTGHLAGSCIPVDIIGAKEKQATP
ncbi:MAG: NAD(P)/FAD-dependent oxidoreductase [Bacteroidales bacterium]|nr:NAD(P)/FAD-dependent oxidoreductase [Bacteroidales bacterium]MCM1414336.1 NAD(P)/FAD-dependent oxidoreductase [bacterium]MCM1422218.1 NAD(P)/FAD-dependent oxidoreductase [bacterium]